MRIVLRSHIHCWCETREFKSISGCSRRHHHCIYHFRFDCCASNAKYTSNRNTHSNETAITSLWLCHCVLIKIHSHWKGNVYLCACFESSDLSNKHIILQMLNDFLRFNKRNDLAMAKTSSCIWRIIFAHHKSKLMILFAHFIQLLLLFVNVINRVTFHLSFAKKN